MPLVFFPPIQLGRAAKDIGSTLESGLHNVAENLEGAFIQLGEGTAERAGYMEDVYSTADTQTHPHTHAHTQGLSIPMYSCTYVPSSRATLCRS